MLRRPSLCLIALLAIAAPAHLHADVVIGIATVYGFGTADGNEPYAGVTLDAQGNIYGTTQAGGASNRGTVFRIDPKSHALTTLASFDNTNGSTPYAGVTLDSQRNIYGTTSAGGANAKGTVFRIDAATGTLTTLANFSGANGSTPYGAVALDSQGNIYGTTTAGGAKSNGTVFRIDAQTGALATVATFTGANGSNPYAGVTFDAAGNIYGTTVNGGAKSFGTVFRIDAATQAFSTVASFNYNNGAGPYGGVTIDAQGNLYGTTTFAGPGFSGTVWKIGAGTGTISTLADLGSTGGAYPHAGVILDPAGNLYGTTAEGGNGGGTVFRLDPQSGAVAYLTTFPDSLVTGDTPYGALTLDPAGNLFGTAQFWGPHIGGTVFEITGATVPEPSSLVLITAAVSGALAARSRRRRR